MTLRSAGARIAAPTPTPDVAALTPMPAGGTMRSDEIAPGMMQPHAPQTAACARCGATNPVESRFCHGCGSPVVASAAIAQASPPPPPVAFAPAVGFPAPASAVAAVASPAQQRAPIASPAAPLVSITCGRCRGVGEPGADFCKYCGARLAAPASVDSRGPDGTPSSNNRQIPTQMQGGAPVAAPAAELTPSPPKNGPPNGATRPLHGIGDVASFGRLVRIAKDGSEGASYPIVADPTDVGRTEGNIVLPDDPYLSARHARIAIRSKGPGPIRLALVDLGSVNGVFVRLRSPHALATGDLLLLGQQVLRFEAVSEIEGARGPAMQHGVLLFGSPAPVVRARLTQRTVEGLSRDLMHVTRDELVLGREAGDHTFPDDAFMSRRHAVVRREGSGHVLHDLGSSNGTFVQIHGEHLLQDGDQFRVGHHLFRVDVASPTGAA